MAYINGREILFSPNINITEIAGEPIEGKDITIKIEASNSGVPYVWNDIGIVVNLTELHMLSEFGNMDFPKTISLNNVSTIHFVRKSVDQTAGTFICNITFDMLMASADLVNAGDESFIIDIKHKSGVYSDTAYGMMIGGV